MKEIRLDEHDLIDIRRPIKLNTMEEYWINVVDLEIEKINFSHRSRLRRLGSWCKREVSKIA